MTHPLVMLIMLLSVLACTQAQVRDSNKKWADGVVVASNMCAKNRSAQHSNDPEGQRVYCALEETLGSHIPKCVCRDEMRSAEDRAATVQYLREAEQSRQLLHGN
jgi:hypothetical protein